MVQVCIFSPALTQCLSSTYHYTGEFGVVYHATLTTKDGPTQDVAVKLTNSMVIKYCYLECLQCSPSYNLCTNLVPIVWYHIYL